MGQSSYGQIHFGIRFDEGFEFPWEDGDFIDWWLKVSGFEYQEGSNYERRKSFIDSHPLPVDVINYCRDECPMYILALPGTELQASRGNPEVICRSDFLINEDQEQSLIKFCETHGINCGDEKPKWWLSAYSE